ncbi:MAG: Glutamine-scyllo-inositol transaminase [Candidatus Gottesmanbacteria bacterium GW2011_GWC2_39_8]|uniref:Glutamine-scyllo-inositol transaminase n=1 Tax=Candidatus Gottesmanbacteria bacterium GW2011_GWC2_39_8 TaxID=1618450 RepID=A0A0G0Q6A1_9BACT|nr:MAG: Glutamine-scyllo-inositol transaminase [Candidatus Gottesmanbacteria bacterium GW2011_GWC2_39_8]
MHIPLVNLQAQYKTIKKDIDEAIAGVVGRADFILGDEVEKFEKEFARYLGVKHCIGMGSGSHAILLALRVLGVGPGDEVITVPNTFISTILPILELGARPVLIEINPDTYQMDPERLRKAINKKTKVILPVHLYGCPAPMREIMEIAKKKHVSVLEDACQAHGSLINKKKCGRFGDLAAFSFYPGKNLGAYGDAGCVVTDNSTLANKLRAMRNIGQTEKYKHNIFGYNSRLDTIQAAVLSVKLKHLDNWNKKRRKIAALYDKLLASSPVVLPKIPDGNLSNFHLYVIRAKKRDQLLQFLHKNGVGAGVHYPIPVHLQKGVKDILGYKNGDFPVTEKYAKEILSLPLYPEMQENEVEYIVNIIKDFNKKESK